MINGIDEEQTLFIKIVKGRDAKKRPFTAYVLLTEEQKNSLDKHTKCNFKNTYEIIYSKPGDVNQALHNEVMHFFALKYLDRPLRYVANELPLDKKFFTEEDFMEREPVLLKEFKAKYLRVRPEKLFPNIAAVEEDNITDRTASFKAEKTTMSFKERSSGQFAKRQSSPDNIGDEHNPSHDGKTMGK